MRLPGWVRRERQRGHDSPATPRPYLKPAIDAATAPLGHAIMGSLLPGQPAPRTGFLRCRECQDQMKRDANCSDLAILTLHRMSKHPERWAELHPEDAEYLRG